LTQPIQCLQLCLACATHLVNQIIACLQVSTQQTGEDCQVICINDLSCNASPNCKVETIYTAEHGSTGNADAFLDCSSNQQLCEPTAIVTPVHLSQQAIEPPTTKK